MSEPVTVVHDQSISRGWVFALVFAVACSLVLLILGGTLGYPLHGLVVVLAAGGLTVFAWRRYLRSVSLDSEKSTITAESVLPWLTFTIPLSRLVAVRTVQGFGIPRIERVAYNLVLKRRWAIQPLLFEVSTASEDAAVQRLLASLPLELRSGQCESGDSRR